VIAETQSLSRSRPDEPRIVAPTLVALAIFIGSWTLLHVGFYRHDQVLDTPIYQRYGNAIANGKLPYRDFRVEYPPGALPMFALPGLARPGHDQDVTPGFRRTFESLIWLCGAAALISSAFALRALGASQAHVWAALVFIALAPLAIGSVLLSRFDLWPAALVAASLALLLSDRLRLGCVTLGLAVAVKLFPAVLAPLAVAYVWRRAGRREAIVCLAFLVGAVGIVFAPFVAVAPAGVWHSLTGQLTRPLQIESIGSALLLAAHHAWGFGVTMATSHGSQNLVGGAPHAFELALSALQAAALVATWIVFARGRATKERLVLASGAALVAFVALGKVFSPQFLIWLVPVVPLVGGRRGLRASALLALALVLTQLWFPYRYWDLANHFDALASWLVLARDIVMVVLLVVLFPRDAAQAAA
jgi:hypothetical protein